MMGEGKPHPETSAVNAFPTNPALESAIIAHADEDTPRLAYADWLDEHDDPDRAAFIRVQCRLADMWPGEAEWCELDVQEDELIRRLGGRIQNLWQNVPSIFSYGSYSPYVSLKRHFQRGFPLFLIHQNYGAPTETTQLAALTKLVESTTYRELAFYGILSGQVAELVEVPSFGQLRGLSFSFESAFGEQVETSHVAAYMKLVEAPIAQRLQRLNLNYCREGVMRFLPQSAGFPALRGLKLRRGSGRLSELQSLMAATWLQGLHHLQFSSGSGENGGIVMSAAGQLPTLHTLELRLPEMEISHLAAGEFPRLASLICPDLRIMLRGLQQLLSAPWFVRLRVLDLTSNELGDRAIRALAAHPVARNLHDLRLGNNPIGKTGLFSLAEAGAFPNLLRLDLSLKNDTKRKATEADITKFLSRLSCPRLRSLNLKGLPVGDSGAKALATNLALNELRELQLGESVTEHGMNALKAASHLQQTHIV